MIKNPPIIKRVVEEMGGTIEKVIPERGYFYINLRGKRIFVSRKFKISSNLISGGEITKFKDLTYFLLKENDLPMPRTVCFYRRSLTEKNLKNKLQTLKFPVIIKDSAGSNSKGIFPNIKTLEEAKKIVIREIRNFRSLITQEMVFGKEFRILILKNKVIGALELIPPRVFGNGKDSVKKLIQKKQEHITKTPFDSSLKQILKDQGLSLDSVPPKKSIVYIKRNSSLAEGGETSDVSFLVHPSIEKLCAKAARVADRYLAGLDIICEDISKDPQKQAFTIIEINGKPDIYIHYNPTHGKTRDVVRLILSFILKLSSQK